MRRFVASGKSRLSRAEILVIEIKQRTLTPTLTTQPSGLGGEGL